MKSYTLQSITLLIGSDWWFQATPTICLPLGVTTYPFLRAGHKQMWSPATYILAIINTPFIIYSYGSYGFMSHIWWYSDTPISNHSHNIISNHPILNCKIMCQALRQASLRRTASLRMKRTSKSTWSRAAGWGCCGRVGVTYLGSDMIEQCWKIIYLWCCLIHIILHMSPKYS